MNTRAIEIQSNTVITSTCGAISVVTCTRTCMYRVRSNNNFSMRVHISIHLFTFYNERIIRIYDTIFHNKFDRKTMQKVIAFLEDLNLSKKFQRRKKKLLKTISSLYDVYAKYFYFNGKFEIQVKSLKENSIDE